MLRRCEPSDLPAPVVTHQVELSRTKVVGKSDHICHELIYVVGSYTRRTGLGGVSPLIGRECAVSLGPQHLESFSPAVPGIGKAVQEDDQRTM